MSSKKEKTMPGEAAKDLLLEDYRYLSESFWRNEQVGETRVSFFITLVTAVVGGLTALMSAEHGLTGQPLRLMIIDQALYNPFAYQEHGKEDHTS